MTKNKFNIDRHRQILTEILIDIVKRLGPKIAFKGGTAAMLFNNLPRMSLDLDFDLLTELTDEELDAVDIVLRQHGTIKEHKDKGFTLFYLLDYEVNYPNIKVELNRRVWKNNRYETRWLLGLEIKIADNQTMFTNKLVALSNRRTIASRDLFDVHYFLKLKYPINDKLIFERTNKSKNEYLQFLKKYIIKNFNSKNILQGLGEILDEKQKIWAKENLIAETISELDKL